jgi:carbamoyl-phosphate synthase large subunit
MDERRVAVVLTGVGKRYDIVSAFSQHAFTVAVDPSPLAPARYAADVALAPPRIDDPGYVPFLQEVVAKYDARTVVPLTDLDLEVLAAADLPAFVPSAEIARATFDKYEAHHLLLRLGLPSPPTCLPDAEPESYPVMVKPRRGSGARSIHPAADRAEKDFFVRYVEEPVMVQRLMGGPEFSIDLLCDLDGRCLNAIPRTMIESRGGESIKGTVIADRELVVRMAAGERVEPHVGDFAAGMTFTRWYWQIELDADLRPTGRDIVAAGPRAPEAQLDEGGGSRQPPASPR